MQESEHSIGGGATSVAAPAVDARLVAAVQTRAGARVHESANLLQHYTLAVQTVRRLSGPEAAAAREQVTSAEAALRKFLASVRGGPRRSAQAEPATSWTSPDGGPGGQPTRVGRTTAYGNVHEPRETRCATDN